MHPHAPLPCIKIVANFSGPGCLIDGHPRSPFDYIRLDGGTMICVVDAVALWLQTGERTPAESYDGRRFLEHHLGAVFPAEVQP